MHIRTNYVRRLEPFFNSSFIVSLQYSHEDHVRHTLSYFSNNPSGENYLSDFDHHSIMSEDDLTVPEKPNQNKYQISLLSDIMAENEDVPPTPRPYEHEVTDELQIKTNEICVDNFDATTVTP